MAKHPLRTRFPLYQSRVYSQGTCSTLHSSAARSPQDTEGPKRRTRADPCQWLSIMARPAWRWEEWGGHVVPCPWWDVKIKRQLENTTQNKSQGGL